MTDPLQAILQPGTLSMTAFPATSRYHGVEIVTMEVAPDKPIAYLRRRFISPPESFSLVQEHLVVEGDRPDNIAHKYLGDPEQFWRLCDANNVMRAADLVKTIGRRIRITLPEGFPGS